MDERFSRENKQRIAERLERAIDAEYTVSSCFKYISELVKNGRIRSQFITFAEESERNKKLLLEHLFNFGETNFILEDKCLLCKLTPKSFSLFGALNLGLELTRICVNVYHTLSEDYKFASVKNELGRLLKEKHRQRGFLKKELRFTKNKADSDFITDFCIPPIAEKLIK